jgi:hypothetical protein
VTVLLAHHRELLLAAAVVGLALGAVSVAVYCLATPVRLRLATDPQVRAHLLRRELARLRRLGDEAAVLEEHGLAGAGELRGEAGLRYMLLRLALWRPGAGAHRR